MEGLQTFVDDCGHNLRACLSKVFISNINEVISIIISACVFLCGWLPFGDHSKSNALTQMFVSALFKNEPNYSSKQHNNIDSLKIYFSWTNKHEFRHDCKFTKNLP